jgi:hypothetical protein
MRTALLVLALSSTPAWAVGEKVVLPDASLPFSEQLKDGVCLSMECVEGRGGFDAKLTGRRVKGKKGEQVEVRVLSASGKVKATLTAPAHEGRLSSTDLVSLTSAVVHAIEQPERVGKAAPAPATRKPERLAAKARLARDRS